MRTRPFTADGVRDEPIVIAAPPTLAERTSGQANLAMVVMPIISGSGSLLITLTNRGRPLFAVAGLIFLVASVGLGLVLVIGTRSSTRRRQRENRERYLDYIEAMRCSLRRVVADQRTHAARRYPDPARLTYGTLQTPAGDKLVDGGGCALRLRAGIGVRPTERAVRLATASAASTAQYDPVCLTAARQLVSRYSSVHDLPVPVTFGTLRLLTIVGPRYRVRGLARSLVAQAAVSGVGRITVARTPTSASWDDVKWLPQCLEVTAHQDLGEAISTVDELEPATAAGAQLLIVDNPDPTLIAELRQRLSAGGGGRSGAHVLVLMDEPGDGLLPDDARIVVAANRAVFVKADEPDVQFTPDYLGAPTLRALGRAMISTRYRSRAQQAGRAARWRPLAGVLGTRDVAEFEPSRAWKRYDEPTFLRTPIGVGASGELVHLDLKEAALGGNGPHGLVVGATGSGKSELLRTLLTSLAIRNPPDRLAFLLVDFKGGATFSAVAGVPHVAGLVTNLAEDDALVERFRDALAGELRRRQQLLKDAGGLDNVREYARQRAVDDEPLPHLLVMIDEFSELLVARPDFAELFSAVGRIGRSIGVHLLLATQRLDTARIRGLESHLSYRIALRTFSESESREVLGVSDAYRLDSRPGSGYLKTADGGFEWFRSPSVSVAYEPDVPSREPVPRVMVFDLAARTHTAEPAAEVERDFDPTRAPALAQSVLEVAARRIVESGAQPTRPVWLPPLPAQLALGDVIDDDARSITDPDRVAAVIGRIDVPGEQRQEPLTWELAGATANLVIVGAPRSGKSTALRSVIGSLALRFSPREVTFYCVDFGGGGLATLRALPQLAVVAGRGDHDLVRRTFSEVRDLLDRRERRQTPDDTQRIVFVVDGWGSLRDHQPDLEEPLSEIATRGPALGVHAVVSITTSSQLRMRVAAAFGGRIELRLADRFESRLDRSAAARIPADIPGRALVAGGRVGQVAMPGWTTVPPAAPDDVGSLVEEVGRRWPGPGVAPLCALPDTVELDALRRLDLRDGDRVPGVAIGLSERDLGLARVDLFGEDAHLLVYGDPRSGKSTAVRVLLTQLVARHGPARLGIVLVDYRRSHLGAVPTEYLLAYCTSPGQTAQVAAEVAAGIQARLPSSDVTAEQVRDRSWWEGRDVVVVVDDYDLVATASGNPLAPLSPLLPQGRELGLHLVLARRSGGAARFQFESVIQTLNDLSSPGLLFSGDRTEGRLVGGVAPRRLPPGRVLWVRRGAETEQVQVASCPLT